MSNENKNTDEKIIEKAHDTWDLYWVAAIVGALFNEKKLNKQEHDNLYDSLLYQK